MQLHDNEEDTNAFAPVPPSQSMRMMQVASHDATIAASQFQPQFQPQPQPQPQPQSHPMANLHDGRRRQGKTSNTNGNINAQSNAYYSHPQQQPNRTTSTTPYSSNPHQYVHASANYLPSRPPPPPPVHPHPHPPQPFAPPPPIAPPPPLHLQKEIASRQLHHHPPHHQYHHQQQQQQFQDKTRNPSAPTNTSQILPIVPSPLCNTLPVPVFKTSTMYTTSADADIDIDGSGDSEAVQVPKVPAADSQYIIEDDGNASPRLLKSLSNIIPRNKQTEDKVGVGMGVVCMPLAVPSEDWNVDVCNAYSTGTCSIARSDDTIGTSNKHDYDDDNDDHEEDISCKSNASHVEAVPVIKAGGEDGLDSDPRGVNPIQCSSCHAYWNPFVTVEVKEANRIKFKCNFCNRRNDIRVDRRDVVELPLRFGSVEYEVEVDEEYNSINNGPDRAKGAVHLFALDANDGDKVDTYLNVLLKVAKDMDTLWSRQRESMNAPIPHNDKASKSKDSLKMPRLGFLMYIEDHILIPYFRRRQNQNMEFSVDEEEWDLEVSVMADVEEDPFCSLPLDLWTYSVGEDVSTSMKNHPISKFYDAIKQAPTILEKIKSGFKYSGWCGKNHSSNGPGINLRQGYYKNCGGAALAVLADALGRIGGSGNLLTSSRPNFGVGALSNRQSPSSYKNPLSEEILLRPLQLLRDRRGRATTPSGAFYKSIGERCKRERVSLSIIVNVTLGHDAESNDVGKQYLDIATLGELCRQTCGRFKLLEENTCDLLVQLKKEILRSLAPLIGYNATFKLRCSNGMQFKTFSPRNRANGMVNGAAPSELVMSCVFPDTCIGVHLDHRIGGIPGDLDEYGLQGNGKEPSVYFQSILTYNDSFGRRRVRVSTLALQSSSRPLCIWRSINVDVLATMMTRQAIEEFSDSTDGQAILKGREIIEDKCIQILARYRRFEDAKTSLAKVTVPGNLQLFPLFCFYLRNSRMFRLNNAHNEQMHTLAPTTADSRSLHLFHGANVSPVFAMISVYPNLYDLSNVFATEGLLPYHNGIGRDYSSENVVQKAPTNYSKTQVAQQVVPHVACMQENGIYLLDDCSKLYLFVGKGVSLEARADILSFEQGPHSTQCSKKIHISPASTLGCRLLRIIKKLERTYSNSLVSRPTVPPVVIIIGRGGHGHRITIDDALEAEMVEILNGNASFDNEKRYVEWLHHIHK